MYMDMAWFAALKLAALARCNARAFGALCSTVLLHGSMLPRNRAPLLLLLRRHCCYDVNASCVVMFYAVLL